MKNGRRGNMVYAVNMLVRPKTMTVSQMTNKKVESAMEKQAETFSASILTILPRFEFIAARIVMLLALLIVADREISLMLCSVKKL